MQSKWAIRWPAKDFTQAAAFSATPSQSPKLRVGIRGICGSQGSRIASKIRKIPEFELSLGIAKNDRSLAQFADMPSQLKPARSPFAPMMLLEEQPSCIEQLNKKHGLEFIPADPSVLGMHCDLIIDASSGAKPFHEKYHDFAGPVLLLQQENPGSIMLFAPPFNPQSLKSIAKPVANNIFRLGDCIISAVAALTHPLLKSDRLGISKLALFLVKNLEKRSGGHLQPEMAQDLHLDLGFEERTRRDISLLLGRKCECSAHILFRAGTREYGGSLGITLGQDAHSDDILGALSTAPHTVLSSASETRSTFDIYQRRSKAEQLGALFPPIVAIPQLEEGTRCSSFQMKFFINSEDISVPFALDAARHLAARHAA